MSRFLPLIIFALFAGLFALAIVEQRDPALLASALIDQPLPSFALPALKAGAKGFSDQDLKGRVVIINFFASWCIPCRVEQPVLMELERKYHVEIFGVNYKDKKRAVLAWLKREGDPYKAVGIDPKGLFAIDMGVSGVPESFIIDAAGRVRYRHAGPIMQDDLQDIILPLLKGEGL